MRIRRSTARVFAILALFALLAAACGGGSSDLASTEDAATNGDDAAVVGAIPTTAPVTAPVDDSTVSTGLGDEGEATDGLAIDDIPTLVEDPWEVSVLHVNDDVQIVPAFDAPNGNNITIFDVNPIDSIELEYPLYADTVFGNRLALLVDEYDSTGNWAKVQVPVRPNNTTAWVQTAFFTEDKHNYHITISTSSNTVTVYKGEEVISGLENLDSVMGRESRPTPLVRSYIDEKISGPSLSPAYGDWVLSIAAFSEALGTFGGGGMPKLAIHGTNQPELMGQFVSSGCIRLPNETITEIADLVPVGTIVEIIA